MLSRIGPGPVFTYEWILTSRRWQVYAGRSMFVAILLAALAVVWSVESVGKVQTNIRSQVAVAESFFYAIIGTQLCLVLLAAPAAAAGAVCMDKARGTLAHVLVTDLSNAEIVLGKLAARLLPVVGIVCCAAPVLFLTMLLGGIDPGALLGTFIVTLALAILSCTLALTLSVWGHKMHEVLLMTYLVLLIWLLTAPAMSLIRWAGAPSWLQAWAIPAWFEDSNPFYLGFSPYLWPDTVTWNDYIGFFAACIAISAVLAALGVWRIRAVFIHQLGKQPRQSRMRTARVSRWLQFFPSPSLDGNPVLWREWHRNQPSRWMRLVWGVYATLAVGFSALAIGYVFQDRSMPAQIFAVFVNGFQVAAGMLLYTVTASTTLAEERVRGSLDVLLATPLQSHSIVWGKWWGAFRRVPFLAILPAIVMLAAAQPYRAWATVIMLLLVIAYGAGLTSLGLAVATWVPRLGRVVAINVATFIVVTVGWFFLIVVIFQDSDFLGPGLASASPLWGAMFQTIGVIEDPGWPQWWHVIFWGLFWSISYLMGALVLYVVTLAGFDHALGRISSRGTPYRAFGPISPGGRGDEQRKEELGRGRAEAPSPGPSARPLPGGEVTSSGWH